MKVITDIGTHKEYIQTAIRKYASNVEHHFTHWMYMSRKDRPNVFFDLGNHTGILARRHIGSENWYVLGDPLGPRSRWFPMLLHFIEHISTRKKAKKVFLEVEDEFRNEVLEKIRKTRYHDCALNSSLYWPVFDMAQWDENLSGKSWKKIRNILNRFKNDHRVQVRDSRTLSQEELLKVVHAWKADRHSEDKVDASYYEAIIKNNFAGMDLCRSVVVDGKVRSITCGWYLPRLKTYYSAIGIYDYQIPGLGEYCNMDDLLNLKKLGFAHVDFGGSDTLLMDFKRKFRFHRTYETFIFSIVKGIKHESPKDISFEVVKSRKRCQQLWEHFSPNKNLFDVWEYRECFFEPSVHMFHFIAGYRKNQLIGVLPLISEPPYEMTFIGDNFAENNLFFMKDPKYLPHFLRRCPRETSIYYISASEREYYPFKEGEKQYYLDMQAYGNDLDAYIDSFSKKHRKNVRYELRQLKKKGYSIARNRLSDFDELVQMNKQRFGKESDFKSRVFVNQMRKVMETAHARKELRMFSIVIKKKVVAVQLSVVYNGIYYVLASGRDVSIPSVGKLLIVQQIQEALREKCSRLNFLTTDSGWKEQWHLQAEQLYQFVKK